MKWIKVAFVLMLFSRYSAGQINEDNRNEGGYLDNIIKAKNYREGIYKNYNEFKSNTPSIVNFTISKPEKLSGFLDFQLLVFDEEGKAIRMKEEIWGFCRGDSIFINLSDRSQIETMNTRFAYLESIGKYCAFEKGPGRVSMVMGSMYGGTYGSYDNDSDFAFDIIDGIVFPLRYKFLKGLVASSPELKEQFKGMKLQDFSPFYIINEYNIWYLKRN